MPEVLQILIDLWKFDVKVFSSPWLYIPFLIPAAGYLAFFFLKWTVLTSPVWLPLRLIFQDLGRIRLVNNKKE